MTPKEALLVLMYEEDNTRRYNAFIVLEGELIKHKEELKHIEHIKEELNNADLNYRLAERILFFLALFGIAGWLCCIWRTKNGI